MPKIRKRSPTTISIPSQTLLYQQTIKTQQYKLIIGLLSAKVNYTICYLGNVDDHPASVWTLAKAIIHIGNGQVISYLMWAGFVWLGTQDIEMLGALSALPT